jgi:hypothetical protein
MRMQMITIHRNNQVSDDEEEEEEEAGLAISYLTSFSRLILKQSAASRSRC